MKINENYLKESKDFFEKHHNGMTYRNHSQHNSDPEYWNQLLGVIKYAPEKWAGKKALDFGCGCGRNIKNLIEMAEWEQIDGCDISKQNADYAKKWVEKSYPDKNIRTWENNGKDIQPCEENYYDFIMSHIVFQHISSYSIRFSILTDMFNCLKKDGLASIHYQDMTESVNYSGETTKYDGEMGNCRVENKQYLIDDFEKIGFKDITCEVGEDYFTKLPTYYIKGYKR